MRLTQLLQSRGYAALPIPASVTLDEERNVAALSHKAVTVAAGLGWQGKSLLTVHPRFGPRIRLATVLTDAPLEPHAPIKNRCGKCTRCMDACPAGAIRGVNTDSHYESREEALRFSACVDRLRNENTPMPNIGAPICGVCIRACPFGGAGKS
jgi:epoxyqueuosine reductase QueG